MTIGRIKTFRLVYVLEKMIYFRIDGPKIDFGFIVVYFSFNKFWGCSIHLFGILSARIRIAKTCSYISFNKLAVFISLPHIVIKLGISDLQFIQMHMHLLMATTCNITVKRIRDMFASPIK